VDLARGVSAPYGGALDGVEKWPRWCVHVVRNYGIMGTLAGVAVGLTVAREGVPAAAGSLVSLGLAIWAAALATFGTYDLETMRVPSVPVRRLGWLTVGLLAAAVLLGGGPGTFLSGSALCGLAVWAGLSGVLAVAPAALGLGDVRLGVFMAIGAGSLDPGLTLVVTACCLFVAGVLSRPPRRSYRARPVALGPLLALGGLMVVAARAV
jgi:prepilin signal peptidase PulO-like enzyme (type II secretory pathway)